MRRLRIAVTGVLTLLVSTSFTLAQGTNIRDAAEDMITELLESQRGDRLINFTLAHKHPTMLAQAAALHGLDVETFTQRNRQGYARSISVVGVAETQAYFANAIYGQNDGWDWAMVPVRTALTYKEDADVALPVSCGFWFVYGQPDQWYLEALGDPEVPVLLELAFPAFHDLPLDAVPLCDGTPAS